MHDVIVVGGGVIGLAIARELAGEGRSVLLLERGSLPGAEEAASWAAAGMLAPLSEASAPDPFFQLCAGSLKFYPAWADALHSETSVDTEYTASGLLFVASTEDALCRLKRNLEWQRAVGFPVEALTPEEARAVEPRITLPLTGAVFMPGEHQVTPRRLLEALRTSCGIRGVEIRTGEPVLRVLSASGSIEGVETSNGFIPARHVIIASGVGSSGVAGLDPPLRVTPRKGQILALEMQPPFFNVIVRWEHAYFVPRRHGALIVGATNEDAGFDRSITPSGVGYLLSQAQQLSAHTGSFAIREIWTGLRPASPDNLPVIGRASINGLIYATGHYRNGILLAPVTAAAVADLLAGRTPAISLESCRPLRFAV